MQRPHTFEVLRALAFVGGAGVLSAAAAASPELALAQQAAPPPPARSCPSDLPTEGVACAAAQRCQYGRGPQLITCHCAQQGGRWAWTCPDREAPRPPPGITVGPLAPPELA